jgi:hypothetical protein
MVFALALTLAQGKVPDRGKVYPKMKFARSVGGQSLLRALGTKLEQVASYHGMTAAQLRKLVLQEPCLRADKTGQLHYVCPSLPALMNGRVAAVGGSPKPEASLPAGPFAESQTFLLHSLPGAPKVIHLDFTGHSTTGTAWNTTYNSGAAIVTPAFNQDGDAASYSGAEHATMQQIWQRVAEDYAPFNVDVTTEDPGSSALRRTNAGDQHYGIRVCVGGSSYDWFGSGAGGLAYLDSFDASQDVPVFIFPAQLGNGNAKYSAEAVSHEVGHSLGLGHDGQTGGVEYYAGHGSWAPIMGVSYYADITQWSKGEYSSPNNTQDDLALIASHTDYRADDHGNNNAAATVLIGASATAAGIINDAADIDVFRFTTDAGPVTVHLTPAQHGPNLNLQLKLHDSTGSLLQTISPTPSQAATLSTSLPSGQYFISVDGVGEGSATTGYTAYGSLGAYYLAATVVQNPRLHVQGVMMSRRIDGNQSQVTARVRIVDQLGNKISGATISGAWTGLDNGSVTLSTHAGGQVAFISNVVTGSGAVSFQVTNVSLPGAVYESGQNVESGDQISW